MSHPSPSTDIHMTKDEHRMLKAGSLWFPLAMVVSLIVFSVTGAWILSNERSEIHGKINGLTSSVRDLSTTVEKVLAKMGTPDGDTITRQQWLIECLQLQILNPGWRCPYGAQSTVPSLTPNSLSKWATRTE